MDLPQIGAHCALASCNVLDFLPITCKCNKQFCSEHIASDRHDCSASRSAMMDISTCADPLRQCAVDRCKKPSLRIYNGSVDETCSLCHKLFCAEHRFPNSHNCSSIIERESGDDKTTKNRSLGPVGTSKFAISSCKPPKDPAKLIQWQKVEVMKMRHRAVPGDPKDRKASIPPDQRHHIKVIKDHSEKVFWFRKNVIAGKALDLLVGHLHLTFPSNTPLRLAEVSSDECDGFFALRNDRPLSEQVQDGCTLEIRLEANGDDKRQMENMKESIES